MGQETLDFTMVGDDVVKYTSRFYELARLAPAMDEPESKKLERYIWGLSPKIHTKEFLKWFEEIEKIFRCGDCRKEDKVKFATCTFRDHAQEWWTKYIQIVGVDTAYSHSWEKLKMMMSLKFCVRSELRAMGQETLDFTMVGDDVVKYTTRFYELARLAPAMDEPESKKLERYIWGLTPKIHTKEFLKWFEEIETIFRCGDCRKEDKVKFATCTFRDHAQEWWTKYIQIVGVDTPYSHSWEKLKMMMSLKFCLRSELRAMGQETLDFTMVGDDVVK
ncbi:retrotransposon gag domain-containing protein [Artemisia annua]|uniref:Retrotransposon gag domain-containing protein n=1 Tax=Artemisia annua TaxID=35608 RepID=A0A2U1P4M5_ARTAN|nr:retrotransposon gag domain-containing protein [Artemisia annua]